MFCLFLKLQVEYTPQDVEEWNKDTVSTEDSDQVDECNDDNESEGSDCEILPDSGTRVAHCEAVKALDVAIKWAQQNASNISEIITLKKIHEKAVLANLSVKQKQSKITSYFSARDLK